jgi:hypothetical protein
MLLHDADYYGAPGSWQRTVAALPRVLAELDARGLAPTTMFDDRLATSGLAI